MSIRSQKEIKKSRIIAVSWLVISLVCAVCIGFVGRAMLPEYQPMLDEGKVWVNSLFYTHGGWHKYFLFRYELRGDSVVGNVKYKKCYAIPEKTED